MLDIFENLNLPEARLHAKFKILRDTLSLSGEQNIIKETKYRIANLPP